MTRVALAAGLVVGILWLAFVGVPLLLPSYLDIRSDLDQARADLKAYEDSFTRSEDLRDDETNQCRAAVQSERDYWLAYTRDLPARGERFDAAPSQEPQNAQTRVSEPQSGLCGGFEFVSAGQLHQPADRESPDAGPDEPRSADLREP